MLKKGFIAPIIAIALVVVSLGAGAYYFLRIHFADEFASSKPAVVQGKSDDTDDARDKALRQALRDQYQRMKDAFASLGVIVGYGDSAMQQDYELLNQAIANWFQASDDLSLLDLIDLAQSDAESIEQYIKRLKKLVDDLAKGNKLSKEQIDKFKKIIADAEDEVGKASDAIDKIKDEVVGNPSETATTSVPEVDTGRGIVIPNNPPRTWPTPDSGNENDDIPNTSTTTPPADPTDNSRVGSPSWQYPDRHRARSADSPDLIEGDNLNQ